MKKIYMYAHGGSGNHGCEAIVRSTAELLQDQAGEKMVLLSSAPQEDKQYGVDQLCEIVLDKDSYKKNTMAFVKAYLSLKFRHNYVPMDKLDYKAAIDQVQRGDIALSIGGDNYCYADVKKYTMLHDMMLARGAKTVLWGCSVEPKLVEDVQISADLSRYHLIVARETISYEALKKVNDNTVLVCDPAFYLKPKVCQIDPRLESGNVVGINLSPMIVANETVSGMAYENYRQLITRILTETTAVIALIPHVIWKDNDDREVLKQLYHDFNENERIVLVEDHSAPELKYIISKCNFFVGARTHATIAAYSTGVPTLVVGYSVKARGIAKDLFGTEDGYVLPVQNLRKADDLTQAFNKLYLQKEKIQKHLLEFLPKYKQQMERAQKAVELLKDTQK